MNKKELIKELLSGIFFVGLFFLILFGGYFILPALAEVLGL